MAPKILIVLTSHNKIDALNKQTGWYLSELAHPYYKLSPHYEIVVASPAAGEAPLDEGSVSANKEDPKSMKFLGEKEELWKNTEKLESFKGQTGQFAAIFFVGGHGPMFDLAISETSQQIVREFYESSKVVAAVCHGPAALVNVKLSDGTYLIAGQGTTGLSNTEEKIAGAMAGMPFSLEDALKGIVAMLICSRLQLNPFGPKVVVSGKTGNLITGQNPASAGPIAEAMLKGIK